LWVNKVMLVVLDANICRAQIVVCAGPPHLDPTADFPPVKLGLVLEA